MDFDHFTALPRRPADVHLPRVLSTPSPSPGYSPTVRREPLSPALASSPLSSRKFHMPFSTPTLQLKDLNSSTVSSPDTDVPDSPVSSSFPTFVNPPHGGTVSIDPDGISETGIHPQPKEDWREILAAHSSDMDKGGSLKWDEDGKSDFDYNLKEEVDYEDMITEDSATCTPRTMPSIGSKFPSHDSFRSLSNIFNLNRYVEKISTSTSSSPWSCYLAYHSIPNVRLFSLARTGHC